MVTLVEQSRIERHEKGEINCSYGFINLSDKAGSKQQINYKARPGLAEMGFIT
jgi:hypothetical protein